MRLTFRAPFVFRWIPWNLPMCQRVEEGLARFQPSAWESFDARKACVAGGEGLPFKAGVKLLRVFNSLRVRADRRGNSHLLKGP
eukprot:3159916-Pleurochrysis_carterae.AAC.5